jgi:hypothetical protein
MALPSFDSLGDLPEGLHRATLSEVLARFAGGTRARQAATASLLQIHHNRAALDFGASVFWIRPAAILIGTIDEFLAHWEIKRDKTRRGIVEVLI